MKIPHKLICSIFNLKHYDSPDVRELQLSVHWGGGGGHLCYSKKCSSQQKETTITESISSHLVCVHGIQPITKKKSTA
jgi:hypothetical protein